MSDDRIPAPALDAARQAARRVRELEARADEALHGKGDAAGHRALMIEKCETLADLPETVEPLLGKTPGPAAEEFLSGLADISRRAGQALDLGSIFYMTALLYPEDYAEGDQNDLERFLDGFRAA
ncbi:MAG: hypothetical protein GYA47_02645 [Desulfovibrio sp.]|nr:hypothetical protein [Desulfovibrio sp.]